jgi:hypothetical protein
LILSIDILVSKFAFTFNLYRYATAGKGAEPVGWQALDAAVAAAAK